jgi:hypothetical protein
MKKWFLPRAQHAAPVGYDIEQLVGMCAVTFVAMFIMGACGGFAITWIERMLQIREIAELEIAGMTAFSIVPIVISIHMIHREHKWQDWLEDCRNLHAEIDLRDPLLPNYYRDGLSPEEAVWKLLHPAAQRPQLVNHSLLVANPVMKKWRSHADN